LRLMGKRNRKLVYEPVHVRYRVKGTRLLLTNVVKA